MDMAKQDGYDYCMETNLGTENNPMFICYKKGSFNDINNRIQDIKIFALDKDTVEQQFGDNEYKLKFIKEIVANNEYIYLGYKNAVDQMEDREPIPFFRPEPQYNPIDEYINNGYGVKKYSK